MTVGRVSSRMVKLGGRPHDGRGPSAAAVRCFKSYLLSGSVCPSSRSMAGGARLVKGTGRLQVREDGRGDVHVVGLAETPVEDAKWY